MSIVRITRAALVLSSLALAATALTAATPAPKAKGGAAAKAVERGQYLTTVMGCNDCHTPGTLFGSPDFTRQLSGSELGWAGPWGVSFARNLTPDQETGIGSWTEAQIVNAIRTGQRPDGTTLQPPMPWQMFAGLTDEDAHAIATFLKSLPAVSHKVPDKLPPGATPPPSSLVFPAPSAWDAPRSPSGGAPTGAPGK